MLDNADRAALAALSFASRTFEAGQYLLREGDRSKTCSFLTHGFVYRHKIVGDGGRQIVSIHVPRDLIDMQQVMLDEADHNVQALTQATVMITSSEDLMTVASTHPRVAVALWREMVIEASILREWIANVGRRDARARTAHMLCELAIRNERAQLGKRDSFDLPMTQEQLGDALGLTAVHINRTLKTLEADGLIARNKRSVTVANWKGLRSVGDFTAAYLHLDEKPENPS